MRLGVGDGSAAPHQLAGYAVVPSMQKRGENMIHTCDDKKSNMIHTCDDKIISVKKTAIGCHERDDNDVPSELLIAVCR